MSFFSCTLSFNTLFTLCLKKVKFFLKLESNSLGVHNTLEPGANEVGDIFVGTQIIALVVFFFVDFILTCIKVSPVVNTRKPLLKCHRAL